MKNTILFNLLLTILLVNFTVDAGVYKGLDAEGNVVYSDQPFDSAQKFTPPSLTIVDAPKNQPEVKTEEVEKPVDFKYTDFDIISPTNNQTIWNEPDLSISVNLKPSLNTAENHSIWLVMDGEPIVKNSQNTSFSIGRVNRGAHQLQAQVRDEGGKIIVRTRAIVIHVKQTSIN